MNSNDPKFLDKNHTNFLLIKSEKEEIEKVEMNEGQWPFGSELKFRSSLEKNLSTKCNNFF